MDLICLLTCAFHFSYFQVAALEPPHGASRLLHETSFSTSHSPTIKVSSISTPNENKGVSITGSHEVPGKSSTDGRASTGKSGNLSLDALAKAKRALQMQKELAEKLKKLPLVGYKCGNILIVFYLSDHCCKLSIFFFFSTCCGIDGIFSFCSLVK